MAESKTSLGKGLAALLGDNTLAHPSQQILPVNAIVPNVNQPRRKFDEQHLEELISSIQRKGILQPILVRKKDDTTFEIIAGERRWRAAKAIKLEQIPVIILNCSNQEALEIGLIENLQRHDLNPMEEADAIKRLREEFNLTQEEIAHKIGKSRSHIANILRLTTLDPNIQDLVRNRKISAGHARALITASDPNALAQEILDKNLSVRETESKRQKAHKAHAGKEFLPPLDTDIQTITQQLAENLNMQVQLKVFGHSGFLSIRFQNLSQLDILLERLQSHPKNSQF